MRKTFFTLLSVVACLFASCQKEGDGDAPIEAPEAKVGYYYYSDKSYSAELKPNKTPIGIVFWLNPDKKSGKIVSLAEPTADWAGGLPIDGQLEWYAKEILVKTDAASTSDGKANMQSVAAWIQNNQGARLVDFPVFKWCAEYATPGKAAGEWYLPASTELMQLYAAMSGLKWVASGAVAGEVNNWEVEKEMPDNAKYAAARTTFNALFTAPGVGGSAMNGDRYWSSTENTASSTTQAYSIDADTGEWWGDNKRSLYSVRAIAHF